MSEAPFASPTPSDINDNDKLMAALGYLIAVIMPIIILVSDNMKVRPYQKYHALNSLGLSVAATVVFTVLCVCVTLLSFVGIGFCLMPLLFVPYLPGLYYAYVAYAKPSYFEIPVVTKFMRQQGWLTM